MKKSLLLSAAVIAAISANAEVINYDFNLNPEFFSEIFSPDGLGVEASGNYDIIDKTGSDINTNGDMFNEKDAEDKWVAVKNRCIDLVDGQTYGLDEVDAAHPFICWDQEGVGPARTLAFGNWNRGESYVADADYGAASEADYIADSPHALSFLRNANTGSRQDTYVQFPVVTNPSAMTIWIGNQGGSYHESGLYAVVTPVVNGEALEPIGVGLDDGQYVGKRYYKFDVALPEGLTGDVAFRVGCGKKEEASAASQVHIIHVRIETAEEVTPPDDASVNSIIDTIDENAPAYNMNGVKVDNSYKGIVVKNGQKYVQK